MIGLFFQLDVANAFNSMSKGVIFQELHAASGDIIQFIPFICALYAFKSHFFCSYRNRENDVTIIHLPWGLVKVTLWGGHYSF
jgi:hypothetical protein